MAKLLAYPSFYAFFLINFDANSAQSLEENKAIFSQYTLNDLDDQRNSFDCKKDPLLPKTEAEEHYLQSDVKGEGQLSPSSKKMGKRSYVDREEEISHAVEFSTPRKRSNFSLTREKRYEIYKTHISQWLDLIKTKKPTTPEEHRAVFLESFPEGVKPNDIYHVFIDSSSQNTHFYAPGATPQKDTPRRKANAIRLLQGKSSVWVDPRDNQTYKYHMHHVGQDYNETILVMVPVDIHYAEGMHTSKEPSKIDRSRFATERKNGRIALGKKLDLHFDEVIV